MMQVNLGNGQVVELDTSIRLSAGGEGRVYFIKSPDYLKDYAIKIYKPGIAHSRKAKIEYMVKNHPSQIKSTNHILCWPKEIVYQNNQFVGFMMPKAFPNSKDLYGICLIHVEKSFPQEWHVKFDRMDSKGVENRFKVCFNLCAAVASLHYSREYIFVDFKPSNVLLSDTAQISLVDMDSVQISKNGKILFHGEVGTPENLPPESKGQSINKSNIPLHWVDFSLGISLYQILFGAHPYSGTFKPPYDINDTQPSINAGLYVHGKLKTHLNSLSPPHKNVNIVPIEVKDMFYKCFEEGNSNPTIRPSAIDWMTLLNNLITNGKVSNLKFKYGGIIKKINSKVVTTPPLPLKKKNYLGVDFDKTTVFLGKALKYLVGSSAILIILFTLIKIDFKKVLGFTKPIDLMKVESIINNCVQAHKQPNSSFYENSYADSIYFFNDKVSKEEVKNFFVELMQNEQILQIGKYTNITSHENEDTVVFRVPFLARKDSNNNFIYFYEIIKVYDYKIFSIILENFVNLNTQSFQCYNNNSECENIATINNYNLDNLTC